jgi:aminobenzoyl-glutamate utilization protein B
MPKIRGEEMKSISFIFLVLLLIPSMVYAKKNPGKEFKKVSSAWIDSNTTVFRDAALSIHSYAETALKEYKSSALLSEILEKNGFTIERGVAGIPTAFVATYGSGSPVIGILAEYDALPGLSQKAGATEKVQLVKDAPGHGCGHNIFGAASIEAAVAVSKIIEKEGLRGTIKLFGCPAEETVIGKVYMARAGVFDGLDVCLNWHPGSSNDAGYKSSLAMNNFEVIFRGQTAHAAINPSSGKSALDAVELMDVGVNFLREHIGEKARIHYVIKNGGMAPNIVPDYASVWYYVRDVNREGVEEIYSRVLKCAEGAALMTGTTYEIKFNTGVYNYLPNRILSGVVENNLKNIGPISYTEEEENFAKSVQKSMGVNEAGYSTVIAPLPDSISVSSGSSDAADVSWIVPLSGELNIAVIPNGIPGHSWGVVSCSGTETALKGMDIAAKVLSASFIDLLLDKSIVEKARIEFNEKTKDKKYKSPLPEGQKIELPSSN